MLVTLRDGMPLRDRSLSREQLLDQGPGPVHRVLDLDFAVDPPSWTTGPRTSRSIEIKG